MIVYLDQRLVTKYKNIATYSKLFPQGEIPRFLLKTSL